MESSIPIWFLTAGFLFSLLLLPKVIEGSLPKLLSTPAQPTVGYTGRAINFTWRFSNQSLIDEINFGTWNTEYGYMENTIVHVLQSNDGSISVQIRNNKAVEEYRGRIRWAGDVSRGVATFELSGIRHSDKRTYAIDLLYKDDDGTERYSQTKLIVQDPSEFISSPSESVSHSVGEQVAFIWRYRLTDYDAKELSRIIFGVYRGGMYKEICVVQVRNRFVTSTNCSTGVRKSASHITTINPQDDATFVLSNIDLEDEAVYSIRLGGTLHDMENKTRLLVTVLPKFLQQPRGKTTLEGNTLMLTCEVQGKPRPTIKWFKDNETLETNSTEHFTIPQITREDAGQYHCVAENEVGKIISDTKAVVVQYPPAINSSKKVNIIRVPMGTEMWLTCPTLAYPPANVQWFAHGALEKSGTDKFKVKMSISFDFANYTCVAKNSFGQDNVTFVFREVGPPLSPRVDCGKERRADLSCNFIFHWNSPTKDGGAPVLMYTIKYRSFSSALERNTQEWKDMNVTRRRTWYKFKLKCLKTYEFSVTAWNMYGESEFDVDNTCLVTFGKGFKKEGDDHEASPEMPTQEIAVGAEGHKVMFL